MIGYNSDSNRTSSEVEFGDDRAVVGDGKELSLTVLVAAPCSAKDSDAGMFGWFVRFHAGANERRDPIENRWTSTVARCPLSCPSA